MRRLGCFLALLLLPLMAGAQGFNSFSGRNHPELDWQVAETEHFEIMAPARLAGIEAEAASIAEATYDALSANLGVTFDEKIRIYLSDEDEIVNGFAVPLGAGYTNIWVHQNAGQEVWTGREKWLRKVLAHELAHIFHYRAVRSRPRLLNVLLGEPLPRFWTEGLAQYETETWDAQRGDRWLRTAVLDDALSYDDGRSAWNGRLLYASGNAQLRYFASQYGDSTLADLLAHRTERLFGLAKVHDFDAAFEAVVDTSYRDFYDDWRRHVNVYYNTLAGEMEPLDSLGAEPLKGPGQYLYDVQMSPDTSRLAVLALTSLRRPVRRLFVQDRSTGDVEIVAEGTIRAPVAWSPDGQRLAFAHLARGAHSSLLHDLFVVDADGSNLRRLTHSRRASSPAFAPDGERLAFIGSEGGTANVFTLDLATGDETQHTSFTGDVQLSALAWHPTRDTLAVARFAEDGTRDIVLLDLGTGALRPITPGQHDDRIPVWSPDGRHLAYTSLRDDVPNVFAYDLADSTHRRVTYLVSGATATDWTPPDSAFPAGALLATVTRSKEQDLAVRFDATRTAPALAPDVPSPYAAWTRHRPPATIPSAIAPDASLITDRYPYDSWSNLTHGLSLAVPYYGGADDWGIAGGTAWLEPLGKHLLAVGGSVSVPDPQGKSAFYASYVNNQWWPSLGLSLYRLPGSAQRYGDDVLVEDFVGGDVSMSWPLDWSDAPFVEQTFSASLRYIDVNPLDLESLDTGAALPAPTTAQQADLRLWLTMRKQRPYRHNVIHPLDGLGVRLKVTASAPVLGTDSRFLRGDASAFAVLPALGLQRLFLHGRVQAQTGTTRPQDLLGLSRYDHVQINLPDLFPFTLSGLERVRGYRRYALGNRVLFGSAEYRVPLLPDLQTQLLGVVSLGATSLAAFADAGLVWTDADLDDAERRLGLGLELKNALHLGGVFELGHSLGVAQRASKLGTTERYEVYYRIRGAVPF
ncbi:MAG: BamA/TamA family outer membrane protein [Bacteroidetes bacterium]|jgi:WD40 repeat protein|nr:BamA/TamA family outer membrane protein [Bacteroidota bacterium]